MSRAIASRAGRPSRESRLLSSLEKTLGGSFREQVVRGFRPNGLMWGLQGTGVHGGGPHGAGVGRGASGGLGQVMDEQTPTFQSSFFQS